MEIEEASHIIHEAHKLPLGSEKRERLREKGHKVKKRANHWENISGSQKGID
ncbi:MAG: hypothetical protein R6U96_15260 [Promethearchaeia archaeon]